MGGVVRADALDEFARGHEARFSATSVRGGDVHHEQAFQFIPVTVVETPLARHRGVLCGQGAPARLAQYSEVLSLPTEWTANLWR
jgi:hypothetical protein